MSPDQADGERLILGLFVIAWWLITPLFDGAIALAVLWYFDML